MNFDQIPDCFYNSAKVAQQIQDRNEKQRAADMQHQVKVEDGAKALIQQQELLTKQVALLTEQNNLFSENYKKLEAMYDAQVKATEESREDLRRSRRFNGWMMFIAIISMLATVAGPIVTLISG